MLHNSYSYSSLRSVNALKGLFSLIKLVIASLSETLMDCHLLRFLRLSCDMWNLNVLTKDSHWNQWMRGREWRTLETWDLLLASKPEVVKGNFRRIWVWASWINAPHDFCGVLKEGFFRREKQRNWEWWVGVKVLVVERLYFKIQILNQANEWLVLGLGFRHFFSTGILSSHLMRSHKSGFSIRILGFFFLKKK